MDVLLRRMRTEKAMSERELFMQAYTNLRSAGSIHFPDAVFDEFIRLRQGYKLVPTTANKKMLKAGYDAHNDFFFDGQVQDVYKAMIGACDD